MPNDFMALDYVADEIGVRLGGTGIEVELEGKDVESCLRSALTQYNRFMPRRGRAAISVTTSQKKYPISHPSLRGIVDVQFLDPYRLQTSGVDPFDPLTYLGNPDLTREGDTFGQFDQRLQYIEMARLVTSAEPEWLAEWERDQNDNPAYYLYIDVQREYLCSYIYTWHITPDDDSVTGLRWVPDADTEWVLDYATARAKQILSRIRGKFAGITGPDGGDQQVDWQELATEGREDEQRLREEVERRRRPMTPELG